MGVYERLVSLSKTMTAKVGQQNLTLPDLRTTAAENEMTFSKRPLELVPYEVNSI